MRAETFFTWLRSDYGLKTDKSALAYVRRAAAVETAELCDLDAEFARDGLLRIATTTKSRGDLTEKVRADYATALNRYREFRQSR